MGKHYFCYVAGPISQPAGHAMENAGRVFRNANELLLAGVIPIVPHSTLFWQWFLGTHLSCLKTEFSLRGPWSMWTRSNMGWWSAYRLSL